MIKLTGTPISEGVGIGKVVVIAKKEDPVRISADAGQEKEKLNQAFDRVQKSIESQISQCSEDQVEQSAILEAHLMMIQDPQWKSDIEQMIDEQSINASFAVLSVATATAKMFAAMDSDYFKERAADIMDIGHRLIDVLDNRKNVDLAKINEPTILFAYELLPSQTVLLDKKYIKGLVTEQGGKTSHTAIMAKALGIPLISGVREALNSEFDSKQAIIAVEDELIIIEPSQEDIKKYEQKIKEIEERHAFLQKYIGVKTRTLCGNHIEVAANIALPEDVERVLEVDAEGVGLFRSEFLYMDRSSAPSEEEQYQAYTKVLKAMGDKPVIIRTMDIGGDKAVDYLGIEKEENPFLGLRALRYCLREPDLFKVQIRALLRAGVHGKLRIMLPMVSKLQEVRDAKEIIAQVKEDLRRDSVAFNDSVEVGIMIEVPSAALIADILAKEVDFFSVGTNDLIQYTAAVDRMNATIADLYSYYDPAVLRLLHFIAKSANENGIFLGMCGDVAGDKLLAPYLVAIGFNELSVTPTRVLALRHEISQYRKDNKELVDAILNAGTVEEVLAILKK